MFQEIGKTCGGLKSMDRLTMECEEIRWACLEVVDGDLRGIPCLISVIDGGKLFPVVITIEGEISVSRVPPPVGVGVRCLVGTPCPGDDSLVGQPAKTMMCIDVSSVPVSGRGGLNLTSDDVMGKVTYEKELTCRCGLPQSDEGEAKVGEGCSSMPGFMGSLHAEEGSLRMETQIKTMGAISSIKWLGAWQVG